MAKVEYFQPEISKNGLVYSCDNLRINFSANPADELDFASFFTRLDPSITLYPPTTADFRFRQMVKIAYSSTGSMTIGYGFNGISENARTDRFKGFIDVNPNKVYQHDKFWDDFRFIKLRCLRWEIARVDIAVDIPIAREYLVMRKDSRKYELSCYSATNKTEYLGLRNQPGRVKLYNKSLESKLDKPLSRLEITCEPDFESFVKYCPRIYDISGSQQLDSDFQKLTDTDRTILAMEWELLSRGLDAGLMHFQELSRVKREKLRRYAVPESSLVLVVSDSARLIFERISSTF